MSATPKITDLASQNGILSSISLNLDKQRFDEQFETFMEYGWITADIYSYPETAVGNLSDSVNSLRGQKAEVFSDGTKILEGTFNQDTNIRNSNKINLSFDINEDLIQEGGIPRLEDLPSGIDSGADFAETFDIRDLSFKLVKKAKDKVKNSSPSEPDNRKEEVPKYTTHVEPKRADYQLWRLFNKAQDKGIIQLGLVAVVIAGTVGAYVWRNN